MNDPTWIDPRHYGARPAVTAARWRRPRPTEGEIVERLPRSWWHIRPRWRVTQDSTAAFQAAIDEAARRGGGTVLVPNGEWTVG